MLDSSLFYCILFYIIGYVGSSCNKLNYCNGHGVCDFSKQKCNCYQGWGHPDDITYYRAPDCSAKVCPSGKAFGDYPTASDTAHSLVECSGRGKCNRVDGTCKCFDGFRGEACDKTTCFNDCSGHGKCVTISMMGHIREAQPLGTNFFYDKDLHTNEAWDGDVIYGCVCDSSWAVGLNNGETQTPEWFGPDCSLRHCPSGDDPLTTKDETDCYGKTQVTSNNSSLNIGNSGNLCHIDCSNRGICDYATGLCHCFKGFYGNSCNGISALAGDVSRRYQDNTYIVNGASVADVNDFRSSEYN